MPLPALLPAIVAGGSALAGGTINSLTTAGQNRKSREFALEMYNRTKSDNLAFWNLQNEYNSPQAQMKRYQDAGLNKNLVFGAGNPGNAGSIPTPDVQSAQFRSPEWGNAVSASGLGFINAIYDLDIKQAQLDNFKAQNSVIQQEALLRQQQVQATAIGAESSAFKLDFERELRGVSADARREQLRQLSTSIDNSIQENARRAALASTSVQEAAERMLNMQSQRQTMEVGRQHTAQDTARLRKQIDLMKQDGTLKDLDIQLRKLGINPNDPLWSRLVGKFLTDKTQSGIGGTWNLWNDAGKELGQVWDWILGRKK